MAATGGIFKPRYFDVLLNTGNRHKLVIPSLENLQDLAIELVALEIVACVDLEGESWGNVPRSLLDNPDFTQDPISGIPEAKDSETVRFQYTSDIIGETSLTTSIEIEPSELNQAQKSGLNDPQVQNNGLCGTVNGFRPRKLIIKNVNDEGGRVTRQAIVSLLSDINSAASGIASVAFCAGYKGESYKDLGLVIN